MTFFFLNIAHNKCAELILSDTVSSDIFSASFIKLSKDLSNVTCGSDNGDELSLKYF